MNIVSSHQILGKKVRLIDNSIKKVVSVTAVPVIVNKCMNYTEVEYEDGSSTDISYIVEILD